MKTLFITGVSSGLGQALAHAALERGDAVVGTVRAEEDAAVFRSAGELAFAEIVDVTEDASVLAAVERSEAERGPIDVVVANAGYGHEGTVEESSVDDLRRQFEVNVFGAVATIKAVLPGMRQRRRGQIVGITSMGGLIALPGLAFYHGSKFAMEGILSSLAKEVESLGISVTAVEPGSFRTHWAGRSMTRTPGTIADYEQILGPVRTAREEASGNQLGDPDKAAAAILGALDDPRPPVHLLLGSDAVRLVGRERAAVEAEFETWRELSLSTDFAEGAQIA